MLFFVSCQEKKEKYIFLYDTQIDAEKISCGYQIKDKLGDNLKFWLSKRVEDLSISQRTLMGKNLHEIYFSDHIVNDKDKQKPLDEILKKMKPYLSEKKIKFKIFILDDSRPNACTTTGGYVYVTTGLLDSINSEDELALIIGHELGHIENHHTKDIARFITYYEEKENEIKEAENNDDELSSLSKTMTIFTVRYLYSFFNQSDELEADLAGMYLAYKAGYNPEKAMEAFLMIKNWDIPKPDNRLDRFFIDLIRTHPWSEDRYNCAKDYLKEARQKAIVKYGNLNI